MIPLVFVLFFKWMPVLTFLKRIFFSKKTQSVNFKKMDRARIHGHASCTWIEAFCAFLQHSAALIIPTFAGVVAFPLGLAPHPTQRRSSVRELVSVQPRIARQTDGGRERPSTRRPARPRGVADERRPARRHGLARVAKTARPRGPRNLNWALCTGGISPGRQAQ